MLKSAVVPVRPWITDHHRRQFLADGYMVVRNVVPTNLARNAVQEIAAFIDADLSDRATWYRSVPELDGVVPLHHAQSLWDIRQCPNLYQVFTEFFGTPQLLVDINRCIFRPPVHPDFPGRSYGSIHWDADPRIPGRGSLQAVVLLTDVGLDGGGFQCLPQVYQDLEAWLRKYAWESRRPLMAARLLPPVIRARFQGAPGRCRKTLISSTRD